MDFRNEYRIGRWHGPATGRLWYTAECRRWWLPIWTRLDFFGSRDECAECCKKHASGSVKHEPESLGRLP